MSSAFRLGLAFLLIPCAAQAVASGFTCTFSPDSGRVVTFDSSAYLSAGPKPRIVDDVAATLWDARTGRSIATLRGHRAPIVSAFFSPDGNRILTASQDTTARLWDGHTGAEIATLPGGKYALKGALFSPDGTRILTHGDDVPAKLWDTRTGNLVATLEGGSSAAAFSPDGKDVLTGGRNGVILWRVDDGRRVAKLNPANGAFLDIAEVRFAPDGKRIAVGDGATFQPYLWDGHSGGLVATLQTVSPYSGKPEALRPILSLAFSPDGTRLAVAGTRGTFLLNVPTGKTVSTMQGEPKEGEYSIVAVQFSPDGKRLFTGGADGSIVQWDGGTGGRIAVLLPASVEAQRGSSTGATPFALSPDGLRIVVMEDKVVSLKSVRTGKTIALFPVPVREGSNESFTPSAWFSPDGERLVVRSDDRNDARLWDGQTGKPIAQLRGNQG